MAFADQLKFIAQAGLTPLQAHLASRHSVANAHRLNPPEALDLHLYEHGGAPATIRDHSVADLTFDVVKAVAVIREGLEP